MAIWESTGLTVDEVLHLRWNDVDLDAGTLTPPDLPPREYTGADAWLAARAREPRYGDDDRQAVQSERPSVLERVLPRELPQYAALFESQREFSRSVDGVFFQALLAGWLGFAQMVESFQREADGGEEGAVELLEWCEEVSDGYIARRGDASDLIMPRLVAGMINGTREDLASGAPVRLQDVADNLSPIVDAASRMGNPYGESAAGLQVMIGMLDEGVHPGAIGRAAYACGRWQRLLWLAECALRNGAVLRPGRGEALVGDEDEQLTYLIRLAAQQPGLAGWPELQRFVPRRADGWLPATDDGYKRFRAEGIPADPELSERLGEDILGHRHYLLESVSVIELDELGIKRIVLTPEEQPSENPNIEAPGPAWQLAFIVDHTAGALYGRAQVASDDSVAAGAPRTLVTMPSVIEHESERKREELDGAEDRPHPSERGWRELPGPVRDALAAVELVVLAAWRDLVVPDVRDQHYEVDQVRKAKGRRTARAARKGDIEVIRYVPRRLVIFREERELRQRAGVHAPKRLYPVGAFSKRLPEGHRDPPKLTPSPAKWASRSQRTKPSSDHTGAAVPKTAPVRAPILSSTFATGAHGPPSTCFEPAQPASRPSRNERRTKQTTCSLQPRS